MAETRITNAQGQAYEVAMVQCRHKSKGEGGEKKKKESKKAMVHACELQMDGLPTS